MKIKLRWKWNAIIPTVKGLKAIAILTFIYVSCICSHVQAQSQVEPYYEYDNFQQNVPYKSGLLGALFNSAPHLIKDVQTTYNGSQDVWTTAYLPFVEQEFSTSHPLELFGLHYTTAIALASPKNPLIGLYAPVQVSGVTAGNQPKTFSRHALASSLPIGGLPFNYKGPFNTLPELNTNGSSTMSEKSSEYGISVLAAAQQFTRFSHEVLTDVNDIGWNGFDKIGSRPMRIAVAQDGIPGFNFSCMIPDVESRGEILILTDKDARSVSRRTIGHEVAHAITLNAYGIDNMADYSISRKEIEEGFCDIIGHSFRLWMRAEKFTVMDWMLYREYALPNESYPMMYESNVVSKPIAYNGDFYQIDPLDPDYDVHTNGTVLHYWFYLINEGKSGYVDNNSSNLIYKVEPLIPGDISASYTLALRILFNAFATKLTVSAGYHELREATLATAIEFGFVPGSHVYTQLNNAWLAVNVGSQEFTSVCEATSAMSLLDGEVQFQARKISFENNSTMPNLIVLEDCSQPSKLVTTRVKQTPVIASENNYLFSDKNDETESKFAVSIHAFGQLAKNFFYNRFGHGGYDVNYILGDETITNYQLIQLGNEFLFFVPYNAKEATKDRIFNRYFGIVNKVLNGGPVTNPDPSKDHSIVFSALANIYALEIKKEYEIGIGSPGAEDIWTVDDDQSDPTLVNDFKNPKLYGQPALYNGLNWVDGKAGNNAGFLHLFYYLLVHGTTDELGQDNGYENEELPGKKYFINAIDKDLVLSTLWEAYRSVSVSASIDEFRLATLTELHKLDPVKYHPKSKEHIAFYDAWAAVLGLPDYASTLKHFPQDDAQVYPWAAKVGVEVEYPLYESYRLFEVSKSPTFSESPQAPVHRFVSNQAPDLGSGMTYGQINLEAGQRYYVRSRLADSDGARAHCATTDDPHFCESLLNKKKWTLTYPFQTGEVAAPVALSPLKGQEVPAWGNTFSFGQVEGALGYDLAVTDLSGQVAPQNIPVDKAYDEDNQGAAVEHKLVLGSGKDYSYGLAARQTLGSEWAVHVLPQGMLTAYTQAEKDQFPVIHGNWSETTIFTTDIPQVTLKSPADGTKVPLFGAAIGLKGEDVGDKRADYYVLDIGEPLIQEELNSPERSILGTELAEPADGKKYYWRMTPFKSATAPFIPEDQEGDKPEALHFILDKQLVPKPDVGEFVCLHAVSGGISLSWGAVPGAQGYKYQLIDQSKNQVISEGIVEGSTQSPVIAGGKSFPGPFLKKVSAGIKDQNGNWVWGPEAEKGYGIIIPDPINLSPDNVSDVALGNNNSVLLSWELTGGVSTAHLFAKVDGGEELVKTQVTGNSFLLENVPFGKTILWSVMPSGPDNSCNNNPVGASFETGPPPAQTDFGFELRVDDAGGKGYSVVGASFDYSITVTRPDGIVGFTGVGTANGDDWMQVPFIPELGQVINGSELNGQLLDQLGIISLSLKSWPFGQISLPTRMPGR